MDWLLSTELYYLRLPVADQDEQALFDLLGQPQASAHIPQLALDRLDQAKSEIQKMEQAFEQRQGAYWLLGTKAGGDLIGRISLQKINWMMGSLQLSWELKEGTSHDVLKTVLPEVCGFVFLELGLHRIEVRIRQESQYPKELMEDCGFTHEGNIPQQIEFDNQDIDLDVYSVLSTDENPMVDKSGLE